MNICESWKIPVFIGVLTVMIRAQMPGKDVELITEKDMVVTSSVPMKRAVVDRPYFLNDFYGPPVSVTALLANLSN